MDDEPALFSELVEEAQVFTSRLEPLHRRTLEGRGSELRFVLSVPEELATLAAWLAFKADREAAGHSGPLPRPICLRREDGRKTRDWNRARDLLLSIVVQELATDWNRLAAGTHPMLGPQPAPSADYEPVPCYGAIDDDIPF